MFEKIGAFFTAILVVFGGGGIAKYQGDWSGVALVDSQYQQECMNVTFKINISKSGSVSGSSSDGGNLIGNIDSNGVFSGTSGFVDFKGNFTKKSGSGTWYTNSLSPITCSGTFTADKGPKVKASVNVNTDGVNVNAGGLNVNVQDDQMNPGNSGFAPTNGSWSGLTSVTGGADECISVNVKFVANNGRISGTTSDGGALTGIVDANGNMTGTSGVVNFTGSISGNTGSGTWSTNSNSPVDCSGTFRVTKGSSSPVNTGSGSGSVNVNTGGVSVNTGSSGVNVNAGGVNVNTGSTQTNSTVSGSWSGSTRVTSGSCIAVTLKLNISNGRVSGTSSDGGSFVGTLASNGRLTGTSGAVNFVGTVSGNSGSGTWSTNDFSPIDCSGTFTISKGSTSVNTGSGSVNVNAGGVNVNTSSNGARATIDGGVNTINTGVGSIDDARSILESSF
jgi:hypothetical protein